MFALKIVWICMSLSVIFCQEEISYPNLKPVLKPAIATCEKETDTKLDEIKSLTISEPITRSLSCFVECILRQFNLIVDGKFSVETAYTYLDKYKDNEENKILNDVKKTIVKRCAEETNEETDSCGLAGAMFRCMGKELERAGLIKDSDLHRISKRDEEAQKNIYIYGAYYYYFRVLLLLILKSCGVDIDS